MIQKHILLIALSLGLITASCKSVKIDATTVKKHLYTLATDDMEGRKTGTPGIEKAAQYIEKEFKKIGLKHFKNLSSYRQNFKIKELDAFNIMVF